MKVKGVSISDLSNLFKLSLKEHRCWLADGICEDVIIKISLEVPFSF